MSTNLQGRLQLQTWLQEVTAPFPDDTARRLQQELAAHHAEAVTDLTRLGVEFPQAAALRELGDPAALRAELARTNYTLGDLAWLGGDRRMAEAQRQVLRLHQRSATTAVQILWDMGKMAGMILLLLGVPGTWAGVLADLGIGLPTPPGWFQLVPLMLVLGVDLVAQIIIRRFSAHSAAVLWRLWHHLCGALGFLAFLIVVAPFPETVLVVGGLTLLWLILRRPQEALSLLPKALRNAP